MRWGNISSKLLIRVGGVCNILLLPHVARGLETIDVCIWHKFVVVTVGVCGNVCCVAAIVEEVFFSLGVLKYVVYLCTGCDGYFMFVL